MKRKSKPLISDEKSYFQYLFHQPPYTNVINVFLLHAVVLYVSVFVQVWEGLDVVKTARKMLGETNPADSLPGTIRGDFCVEVGR